MAYESIKDANLVEGYGNLVNYVNNVSNGWFSYLFLIATYFIILFVLFKNERDFPESMTVAGFITFLIAAMFWFGGFLDGVSMLIVTSIFLISFVIIWAIRKSV